MNKKNKSELELGDVEESAIDDKSLRRSTRKRSSTRHDDFVDSDAAVVAGTESNKLRRLSNSGSAKAPRDEGLEGYEKFKFDIDCGVERCAYRLSLSHYHCMRKACGYAFCDKTRAASHNERHKKTDAMMADEFQQFRANVNCERADCEYSKRLAHFHCLKCPYICTDSNKVLVHRKQHSKMEDAGNFMKVASKMEESKMAVDGKSSAEKEIFVKYGEEEKCGFDSCGFNEKAEHFHCKKDDCDFATSRAEQLEEHKYFH